QDHAIRALWKFLIYTEVAKSAAEQILSKPYRSIGPHEQKILDLVTGEDGNLEDFSMRLERCVKNLANAQEQRLSSNDTKHNQAIISETLHSGILKELHSNLRHVLR